MRGPPFRGCGILPRRRPLDGFLARHREKRASPPVFPIVGKHPRPPRKKRTSLVPVPRCSGFPGPAVYGVVTSSSKAFVSVTSTFAISRAFVSATSMFAVPNTESRSFVDGSDCVDGF